MSANGEMHPATCWIHEQGARASPTAAMLAATVADPALDEV